MAHAKHTDGNVKKRPVIVSRLATFLYEADLMGFDAEELLHDARQEFQELLEEETERERWDEHDREY